MSRSRQFLPLCLVVLAVCAVYANHFQNGFHFDDSHTVVDNPYIRSLTNLPKFFTDTKTFSVLPANRTYRPFVSASLAIDYALAGGYNPFWFHVSTFLVFLAQLVAMYARFLCILRAAAPAADRHISNRSAALFAVAWYGLHPAIAETVNYIIQRGDVFCAFGVVAALAIYGQFPRLRRTGLYLLPFAFALLSEPPAVVFPAPLFFYVALFEAEGKRRYLRSFVACIPSLAVCCALMILQSAMTPKSYSPSMLSPAAYRLSQPYVLLRYFGSLFLPIHLNADTDLQPLPSLTTPALLGFLFVALLLAGAIFTARRRLTRPIAFGLLWFLIASLPTSLYALSEVENDHRMFLPFVGLVLAVTWAIVLGLEFIAARARNPALVANGALGTALVLLGFYGYGTVMRNQVWRTEESLWRDDVEKSPHNGRGLMNYGLTQMSSGAAANALNSFQRALVYTPNYPTLEINLGIAHDALHHPAEARQHFQRAIALAPADDEAHYFYGNWLYQTGALAEAVPELETAVRLNPARLPSQDVLASAYAAGGEPAKARAAAREALRLAPGEAKRHRFSPILTYPARTSGSTFHCDGIRAAIIPGASWPQTKR